MSKYIQFTPSTEEAQNSILPPSPAQKLVPSWYKNIQLKRDKRFPFLHSDGQTNFTMKACIPVFDALTSGYMITLPCDVIAVDSNEFGNRLIWSPDWSVASTHLAEQVGELVPVGYEKAPYKWHTEWQIKTPKGYSLLITHPLYSFETPFITMSAVVDTDTYDIPLNLPFILREDFIGTIPKGTPIAQIIPIKRENWKSKILKYDPVIKFNSNKIRTIAEKSYKKTIWSKKTYE